MRIVHAADYHGTSAGGFVPMLAALARYAIARGDTFTIVVPDVAGATWHTALSDAGAELVVECDTRAAIRAIVARRPDVVHVHFYNWHVPITAGLFAVRTRIFWHAHSVVALARPLRPSLRTLVRFRGFGARAEKIVAVSHAVARELRQVGADARKIAVVPNAVDARRFRPGSARERELARRDLGLTDDRTIVFFGRDPYLKGADVLLRALEDVPNATVITVATPRETCDALAERARVIALDRVDDVVPLFRAADALAIPSRGEGLSFVVLEAAHVGLAIAASDIPALRESAAGTARAYFSPVGDGAAFALALENALSSRAASPATGSSDPLEGWARAIRSLYDREGAGRRAGMRCAPP